VAASARGLVGEAVAAVVQPTTLAVAIAPVECPTVVTGAALGLAGAEGASRPTFRQSPLSEDLSSIHYLHAESHATPSKGSCQ